MNLTERAILTVSALVAAAAAGIAGPDYTLHEWGTFTTLSASDGTLQPGVEREEEALPYFVESHDAMMAKSDPMGLMKGWRRPLAQVTVRMETPVIYFHTREAFEAKVEVGFRGGSISQWYPPRSGGETPPTIVRDANGSPKLKESTIDFSQPYQGSIRWDVQVTPPAADDAASFFKPGETPSWIYPRQPPSALVRTSGGHAEKYLFYRGVGNFALPVTFSSRGAGRVTVRNSGREAVPGMLVYEMGEDRSVRWTVLPPLDAGGTAEADLSGAAARADGASWKTGVYRDTATLLVRAGLLASEADAMVQTWWPSYFERAGLRVFWVVPRGFTDEVLPLRVEPAPRGTVRVLVGRSEILTPEMETRLVADFTAAEEEGKPNRWEHDRYCPAYQHRVRQLRSGAR